jgi:ubiquinone/menaquinone biosynthesis C-methylase UbiE
MLQIVRERATREHITNISYVLGGIGDVNLGEDQFDRAVLITVLGEIPNQEAALRDLFKAIKPGGFMIVEETIRDPHFQRRGYVTEFAGRYGFREIGFYGNRLSYTLLLEKPISG